MQPETGRRIEPDGEVAMFAVFDLDGTLTQVYSDPADGVDDAPNKPIVAIARLMIYSGWTVEVWTGRSDAYAYETHEWLRRNVGPLAMTDVVLRMRSEGDPALTNVIKGEWLDGCAQPPDVVFDDRSKCVDFWRSRGITTCQVADNT